MTKKVVARCALGVLFVLLSGTIAYLCLSEPTSSRRPAANRRDREEARPSDRLNAWRQTRRRPKSAEESHSIKSEAVVPRQRPDFQAIASNDELKLTKEYKKLLADLRSVLDNEDLDGLIDIVKRMQRSDEWPDGIPTVIHLAALDAMKWFGSAGAKMLTAFMGSSDSTVVSATIEAMEEALNDPEIGDRERSSLLLEYTRVVVNRDELDAMCMQLDSMRPTVRAETALEILKCPNKVAAAVVKENLDFLFCDIESVEDVATSADVKRYLDAARKIYQADPDKAADDEEFFGPSKSTGR